MSIDKSSGGGAGLESRFLAFHEEPLLATPRHEMFGGPLVVTNRKIAGVPQNGSAQGATVARAVRIHRMLAFHASIVPSRKPPRDAGEPNADIGRHLFNQARGSGTRCAVLAFNDSGARARFALQSRDDNDPHFRKLCAVRFRRGRAYVTDQYSGVSSPCQPLKGSGR